MKSDALKWARKQGLSTTHFVQAETLRQLCRITIVLQIIAAGVLSNAVIALVGVWLR
ncbi:hypothetical protein LCGC14_1850680 [marine sediment metagenome]|uniref:Uncharacterized protein n=1 Tax=marine sediment metagenome TaxID=412755 RepID=A0A0F9J9S2_9ZZZZ